MTEYAQYFGQGGHNDKVDSRQLLEENSTSMDDLTGD